MNTVNKVLKKIVPTKKKLDESIKLTAVGDASRIIAVTTQIIKRLEKNGDQYLKLHQQIQNDGDKLMSYFDTAERTKNILERGAKELGVEPSNFVKMLDDRMDDMRTLRKRLTF